MPNLFLLYVKDPIFSQSFYEKLLSMPATQSYPSYVCFTFENGVTLALWSIKADSFVSDGVGHRSEFAFAVRDYHQVEDIYKKWQLMDIEIEQKPVETVFGLTFVALDPDGHRIRVCLDN